jgi:Domain of unknown function (DUF4266)
MAASRGHAARKARQRTGAAGSAAAAWVRLSSALLLCASTLSLLAGCAIEPWVKPYERERLADPIMKLSRESLPDKHREHVREVREGARGGNGVQGGGCGCN